MNTLKLLTLCAANFLLLMLTACERESNELSVVTENLPPFNFFYQDSALGFSSEIVREMLLKAETPAKIEFDSWSDAYKRAVSEPNTLIFSIARTEEREKSLIWIGQISLVETGIFSLSDSSINLQTYDELSKYRFSVLKDSYFHEFLVNRGIEVDKESQVGTLEEMINKLKLGETDLIIGNHRCVNYTIRSMGYYLSDFEEAMKIPELQKDFYVAINRNSDKHLVNKLKKAFNQVQSSGFKTRVINKYMKEQ
ncbi:MAG: substrate-binding periplasmic protein [Chitinispirillaceae bacterium]